MVNSSHANHVRSRARNTHGYMYGKQLIDQSILARETVVEPAAKKKKKNNLLAVKGKEEGRRI